jgi:homogentisate 1,2-dioxygenase
MPHDHNSGGFTASVLLSLIRGLRAYPTILTYVNLFLRVLLPTLRISYYIQLESCFLPLNPKVHVSPTQLAWHPFSLPSDNEKVDFVDGLKTIAGNGDPTLHEGLAIHMYLANASMDKKAFCNTDGDMLILPQQGRLDIQTEFGK